MADLESVLLDDVRSLLARWQVEFAGQPEREREHLWLLALEREQIVAVAYREETVAARVDDLSVDDDVRALIRQTLVWIWKDEELHAEFLRGVLLQRGGVGASMVVYGRQLQGAISGWVSATQNHLDPRSAPLRTGAASVLVAVAGVLGRMPPALRHELRLQTFHGYCRLNVALEASAELAYRRLIDLAVDRDERDAFERIRGDEARHVRAFRVLNLAVDEEGRCAAGMTAAWLMAELSRISPWFIPASLRADQDQSARRHVFGSGERVVVRAGDDADKFAVFVETLDRAGLGERARGARNAAIRVSFMLGYDRADRSNINDCELVAALARYLREHGVRDVAVLESPTVYGNCFGRRSVHEVADYFGFTSPEYRIVDIGRDMRPYKFERGFVQRAISATWVDADLRIVMPKLRTDPTEFAHLCLSTLEGSTGAIDETIYASRRVDFRSATMMLLDVAPPDFAVVDGWAPVADGPFGVMGCDQPADVHCIYAGSDALAVDEAVLADLGIDDPRRAPIVGRVYHWFGLRPRGVTVDGDRPPLGDRLRGAHASTTLRALGTLAYPIYVYLSDSGELFVPAMDTTAFPPTSEVGLAKRVIRRAAQRAFGLHAPAPLP